MDLLDDSVVCVLAVVSAACLLLCAAGNAQAAGFVLEDWNGPTVGSWPANPLLDFNGWATFVSDSATSLTQSGQFGRGLYASTGLASGATVAEWRWQAPGTSTIYHAEFGAASIVGLGCLNDGLRTSAGQWEDTDNAPPGQPLAHSSHPSACGLGVQVPPAGAEVIAGSYNPQVVCAHLTACANAGSPIANSAVFGIQRLSGLPTSLPPIFPARGCI